MALKKVSHGVETGDWGANRPTEFRAYQLNIDKAG